MAEEVGKIYYDVDIETAKLLTGARQVEEAMSGMDSAAKTTGRSVDNLGKEAKSTASSLDQITSHAKSMDGSLQSLNTTFSAVATAISQANTSSAVANMTLAQMNAAMQSLSSSVNSMAGAMKDAGSSTSATSKELSRAEAIIEGLGNQIAILDEAQENGAKSAAVFAAQLRAGSSATDEEKKTIGELAGVLFDMKSAAEQAAKSLSSDTAAARKTQSAISDLESEISLLSTEMQSGSRSAAILAAQMKAGDSATLSQKERIAELAGSLYDMKAAQDAASRAAVEAARQSAQQANDTARIASITTGLNQQIAILDEQQTNGARSAAILAAQLRAGASASEEEKAQIADLTGRLFDMKNGTDQGAKSHGNWRAQMQQAGYQVQDFIVQVQGGQSVLVAFSQQGSQLAGAFGPSGAIIGAIIALGSVLVGTLVKSLGSAEDQMKTLATATNALNEVINISESGVAALSDKYALLARTNAEAATILRNQAIIEYNQAIAKIPDAIAKASNSLIGFGDAIISGLGGGYASVTNFGSALDTLGITTNDYAEAVAQARGAGSAFSATTNSMINTVGVVAKQFGITQQQAFELAKQLDEVSKNKSPEALQDLVIQLQNMKSSTTDGQTAITTFVGQLVNLVREAGNAKANVSALKSEMDNLTQGQKNLIQQSQRELALSKLQGAARARLQALYKAEDAGFTGDSSQAVQMQNEAEQTYKNVQAQQQLKKSGTQLSNQQETIAQKLANLKQQSELAANSTTELSREQAILTAQQSLGKGATQEQITLAGQYAAKKWDTANAIKAQAAAEKLLPEAKENASYAQDVKDLQTAYDAKKITQQQYNQTSEQLEQQHQIALAKIRAQAVVTPQQSAAGEVDPVQQLANQHAQELALIQQFEQQGVIAHQNALALKTAADAQYDQQRTAAQWEILSQQSLGYNMLTSAVDAFSGNASNAITGLITGTMSAQEALRSLGNTILNSVINSIVQVGVEALKNYILGQTLGAASVAATVGMAIATAAAWAPAAALASLASFGANAAPAAAGITSTVGLANGLALAGARYNGGPVSAGGLYQVGENGKPEIYKASNGSQYMIPGDNGSVISNKDMQSGSGSLQVTHNVYNYASGVQVDTQSSQSSNGQLLVETFITDMENGGPMSSQMQQTFGLNRKATGDY